MRHKKIISALAAIGVIACIQPTTQAEQTKTLLGDTNETGAIEIEDASGLLKMALKIEPTAEAKKFYYDMNGNGSVDLEDAAIVLKQALKITPEAYHRSFDEELLLETVSDKGIENAFSDGIYKGNAKIVDDLLKKYGLNREVGQLEDKLGDQLNTTEVCLVTDHIYADRMENVTCQAVSLKESTGEIFTEMEEAMREQDGVRIQDSHEKVLLRIYRVEADTVIGKSIVTEKTIADVVMNTESGNKVEPQSCTIISDYSTYQEFVKTHKYQNFPNCGETFFDTNKLVVYGGISQFQDDKAVRKLVLDREQGVLNIFESHSFNDVQTDSTVRYAMDYIISVPRNVMPQEKIYVQIQPDAVAGYDETTGTDIYVETKSTNPMKYCCITNADDIKADDFTTFLPMQEMDEVWEQLKEQLSSIDYDIYDALVIRHNNISGYHNTGWYIRWQNGILKAVGKCEKEAGSNDAVKPDTLVSVLKIKKGLLQKGYEPELQVKNWLYEENRMMQQGMYTPVE